MMRRSCPPSRPRSVNHAARAWLGISGFGGLRFTPLKRRDGAPRPMRTSALRPSSSDWRLANAESKCASKFLSSWTLQPVWRGGTRMNEGGRSRPVSAAELFNSALSDSIIFAFTSFARHARQCAACAGVVSASQRPGRQTHHFAGLYVKCCPDGLPLFKAWREAVATLNEAFASR